MKHRTSAPYGASNRDQPGPGSHHGRGSLAFVRSFLLHGPAGEELAAQGLLGEPEIHDVAHGDEGHGDEHQQAEGLGVGGQDHHDEVQEVEKVVHGVLHTVYNASFRLNDVFLQQLRHS